MSKPRPLLVHGTTPRLIFAVLAVVSIYMFFAADGPGSGYYSLLSQGFRSGHLYLSGIKPDARLAHLADPYDAKARAKSGAEWVWDASYYRGHYYLYFSPLPVVLFYLPIRIITGVDPPDFLAALAFAAWALLMAVLFLRAALPEKKNLPLPLWIAFCGLGNVIAFTLPSVRIYEVTELCGMAMSATWALCLWRFVETPSPRRGMWMGLALALAIASRPNLAALFIPTMLAVPWRAGRRASTIVAAILVPLLLIGALLVAYNIERFDDPFEFGTKYQLTAISMRGVRVCSLCTISDARRFVSNLGQYLFWPPEIGSNFPWVHLRTARPDRGTSYPAEPEPVVGLVAAIPVSVAGLLLGLRSFARGRAKEGAAADSILLLGSLLVLLGLCTCWWIVARYSLDYTMLLALGTAVTIERALSRMSRPSLARVARAAVAALLVYSIVFGVLSGIDRREKALMADAGGAR